VARFLSLPGWLREWQWLRMGRPGPSWEWG
jgi:hypothetical protein